LFRKDGKMHNNEGIYSMDPMVLNEVKEFKSTPAFKPAQEAKQK